MTIPTALILAAASSPAEASPELLETLVKLASAGTSGICVLAIFWCGVSIMRLPDSAPRNKHVTMRFFMGTCVIVAIVSAVTTFGAGYWDFKRVAALKVENHKLVATNTEQRTTLEQTRTTLTSTESRLNLVMTEKVEVEKNFHALTTQVAQLEADRRTALDEATKLRGQINVRDTRITDLEGRLRVRPGTTVVTPP